MTQNQQIIKLAATKVAAEYQQLEQLEQIVALKKYATALKYNKYAGFKDYMQFNGIDDIKKRPVVSSALGMGAGLALHHVKNRMWNGIKSVGRRVKDVASNLYNEGVNPIQLPKRHPIINPARLTPLNALKQPYTTPSPIVTRVSPKY